MGDFNGDNYEDSFVGDLVNFVASESFQTMFERFFLTFALEFTNDEEHKLRYYELYTDFHNMFEEQLETFCTQKNISQSEFMSRCRAASTEDPKAKHYINILLSSVEYDTFVKLMRIMRPVAKARLDASLRQADAKAVPKDGAEEERGGKEEGGAASKGVASKDDDGGDDFRDRDAGRKSLRDDDEGDAKGPAPAESDDKGGADVADDKEK